MVDCGSRGTAGMYLMLYVVVAPLSLSFLAISYPDRKAKKYFEVINANTH